MIEVRSDQWTGNDATAAATQVCGEFHDQEKLDGALSRLEGSLFQRADLSVRHGGTAAPTAGESAEAEEPTRHDDVRNLRQLGTGIASAAAGMAAAGAVIATGGAALPAVAAAAAGGIGTAAAGTAIGQAAAPDGDAPMHQDAEAGGAILMVHADTPEKQARAEQLLRECGAARVWTQDGAS
ncbi:hypothetical protein M0638_14050 [Roseomonas sp. NAR14]|uniref:Uncharacterized protein n=1 Tax=Roseomonas acroporae TaxID=2937791 RepID=A0A9X1Y8L0_9PROT|nr:hypothetical protein [Roseomonas acroporae]MCK8785508.1 hypothetical protein [Roseomonas acroporae]